MSTPVLPQDLKAKVLAAAAARPAPARAAWRRRAAIVVGLCAAAALLGWYFWPQGSGGLRTGGWRTADDFVERPLPLWLGTIVGSAAIAALTVWAAWGRRRSMLGRPAAVLVAIAIAAPIALLAFKLAWTAPFGAHQFAPWTGGVGPDGRLVAGRLGLKCLGLSLFVAVWPLVALVTLRRGGVATQPVLTGIAFGVASGACGWVLVDAWCPVCYVPHLLLGHVLPIAVYAGVGAALGRWMLRPSRIRT